MKILIYSLNYAPELTGIARYNTELAEWLMDRGHVVRVVCAPPYYPAWRVMPGYRGWAYKKERRGPVSVMRCPLWVPARPSGWRRILHHVSFALSSLPVVLAMALFWHPDVVMVTEPPLLCAPAALMSASLGAAMPWLHIQDLEVEAAFGLGMLRGGTLRRTVASVEGWLMRRFGLISTLTGTMQARVLARGVHPARVVLFPNWVDTAAIRPMSDVSPLRAKLAGADAKTVVLYSGTMGRKQGLEVIVEAARALIDRPDIRFVLCGDGAARPGLEAQAAGLDNVRFRELQPEAKLNMLLNAADIHVLPQRADADGLVLPSKLIGMLASGRPVVATVPADSEIAAILAGGAGVITPPGDGARCAEAIRDLADDSAARRRAGSRARVEARLRFGRDAILTAMVTELERRLVRQAASRSSP
jgi:colanic acid biosynthesis glycosyl transferase WcaI